MITDNGLRSRGLTKSIEERISQEGIKLSVRSEVSKYDAGRITREALAGIGNGGGHAAMAGGFVPFDGNDDQGGLLIREIQERFLHATL